MNKFETQILQITERVFKIPTAPYYEKFVLKELKSILNEHQIPYFSDSMGNLIAGAKSQKDIKPQSVAFIAHTDHPGFHVVKKIKAYHYEALWYGGAPFSQMKDAKLSIHCSLSSKKVSQATIINFPEITNHREGITFQIQTQKELDLSRPLFGAFDFTGYRLNSKTLKITTKAADDLAGCVMALSALIETHRNHKTTLAVFTRAEEVGFIGCLAMIQKKVLPKDTLVISLEASRTLPGALLGHGPVIRLGDASTLFDSNFSLFIQKMAQSLKMKTPSFQFQKRIMDGGSCEATALSQFGYTTMGLAVPLDNYHNMGKNGPRPEIIHSKDLIHGALLLNEVAKNIKLYKKNKNDLQKRLLKLYQSSQKLLRTIDAN